MMRIAAALATAFGFLALGVACGGGGQPPKAEPIGGEAIAFVVSETGASADIYMVNADGSGFGRLGESEDVDWWPTWSPDGGRLAFLSWRRADVTPEAEEPSALTQEELALRRLVVRDLDSGEDTTVADSLPLQTYPGSFNWSSDGKHIVYMAITDPTQIPVRARIQSVDVATGMQTVLAEGQQGFHPAWSPDGTKIAFVGWIGEPDESGQQESELFIMDSDGSNLRQVATRPGPDLSPRWSPDGRRIAWWGYGPEDEPSRLFMVDVESGELMELGQGTDPVWSPDGRRLLFVQEEQEPGVIAAEPNLEVFVLDVETGERLNLTNNGLPDRWPTWSPDGSRIAFVSERDSPLGDIYVMNADGSDVKRLTDNDLQEFMLAWSPGQGSEE
jgi:Tol biopolymer transport system component